MVNKLAKKEKYIFAPSVWLKYISLSVDNPLLGNIMVIMIDNLNVHLCLFAVYIWEFKWVRSAFYKGRPKFELGKL